MKLFYSAIFTILLIFSSVESKAEDAVMIIRFNKEMVNYKKPLQKVIGSTLNVKSDAFFDIVSIVPETNSSRVNRRNKTQSAFYSNNVVDVLRESGIGPDNIRITFQDSDLVKNSEVHIFVR